VTRKDQDQSTSLSLRRQLKINSIVIQSIQKPSLSREECKPPRDLI
jgi:hypothetical protein